jgi:hypothetical protein
MRNSGRCSSRRAVLVLALALAGCAGPAAVGEPAARPSPSAAPSVSPGPLAPSYPDVTRGDTSTAAQLIAYDPVARSAVIEPTLFLTGPDFCKTLHIKASDGRCERDWVTEDSHVNITLPVSPQARLLTMRDGEDGCLGSMETGGTCPLTPAKFAALTKERAPMLVHVVTRDGTLTTIAEEFTP